MCFEGNRYGKLRLRFPRAGPDARKLGKRAVIKNISLAIVLVTADS